MLDIKFVRENPEIVKQNIRNKWKKLVGGRQFSSSAANKGTQLSWSGTTRWAGKLRNINSIWVSSNEAYGVNQEVKVGQPHVPGQPGASP